MTRDAYVELASEADQQLALSLHQKLYNGCCIKGLWLYSSSYFFVYFIVAVLLCGIVILLHH